MRENTSRVRKPICQSLRTKTSYIHSDESEDALLESKPTAQYWCLKTMRPLGPDDILVSPEDCKPGRECFVARGGLPLS